MKLARRVLLVAALLIAGVTALVWWVASTQTALEWMIAQAVRYSNGALEVDGVSGALDGTIRVRRIAYRTPELRVELADITLDLSRRALTQRQLVATKIDVAALQVAMTPSGKPLEAPATLAAPFEMDLRDVSIKSADIQGQTLRDVRLAYRAGAWGHAVAGLSAGTQLGRVTLDGRIGAAAPFALAADAAIAEGGAYAARAHASGNLINIELAGTADMRGARAKLTAKVAPFAQQWLGSLDAHAQHVDLSAFSSGAPQTNMDIDITGTAARGGAPAGTLDAVNRKPGMFAAKKLPVTRFSARYVLHGFESVELSGLRADLGGGGAVTGSAHLGKQSGRVDLTVRSLDLRALHAPLRTTRLDGSVSGRFDHREQRLTAKLTERNIAIAFDAARRGDDVVIREFRIGAGRGEASGKAQLALAGAQRFTADAKLVRLDPSQFGDYPPAVLNGNLTATGTLKPEWRVDGALVLADSFFRGVKLSGAATATVSDGAAQNVKVEVSAGQNALQVHGGFGRPGDVLKFALDAKRASDLEPRLVGALTVTGRVAGEPGQPEFDIEAAGTRLVWQGNVRIATLRARANGNVARHAATLRVAGDGYDAGAKIEGGWDEQRGWSGQLLALENGGATPVKLLAPMPLTYARDRLSAGPAEAEIAGGRFSLAALSWQDGKLDTRGALARVPIAPLLALAGIPVPGSDLRVNGRWSLAATPRLNGTLALTRESGDIVLQADKPLPLHLSELSLDATVRDNALEATLALQAQSAVGRVHAVTTGLDRNAALKLDGKVDIGSLRVLDPLIGTNALLRGEAALVINGSGTLAAPQITGTVAATNLGIEAPQYGLRLRNGALRAELTPTALALREFSIYADEGRLSASGIMSRSASGERRLEWRAENFRVLNRPDMRLKVDGGGTAALAQKKLVLRGGLKAEEGYFQFDRPQAPRLGADVVVIGRTRAAPGAGMRARFETQLLDVDVTLDAGDRLHLVGAGLDTYLSGKLHVQTSKRGVFEARGVLSSVRGVYYAFGQRLEIERGRLIFDGPLDNPALDILAKRRNLAVEPGVQVTGTVRVPSVRLISDPPVSDSEKLAWLTLGHGLQDATAVDLGLLQAAASALVSGGNSVPLTQRIANRIGLDELSLRGSGEAGTQVAAFGKRLTDKLYVEYQQGLAATSTVLRLSYLLTRSLSLRLETGAASGIGLFFTRSYD